MTITNERLNNYQKELERICSALSQESDILVIKYKQYQKTASNIDSYLEEMRKKLNLNERTVDILRTIIELINELKNNDKFQTIIKEQENFLSQYIATSFSSAIFDTYQHNYINDELF